MAAYDRRVYGLPQVLERNARRLRLGPGGIPSLLVHPGWDEGRPVPVVIWMHGRTARKEIDPGRYLRLMRAGLGIVAVDLPGHGERYEAARQHPGHTLDVVLEMTDEIDTIVECVRDIPEFDSSRLGVGGMSAGGMATLARLCRPHPFAASSVEATTGSWLHQSHREMFEGHDDASYRHADPIRNLDAWREIPLQGQHATHDAWVDIGGQRAFFDALRSRYEHPEHLELIEYDRTGVPFEHAGFGRFASIAKDRQRDFFVRWLTVAAAPASQAARSKT